MKTNKLLNLITLLSLLWTQGAAAAPFSAQTHDVYPGDFNGDGKADLLVIAKDPSALSGIYLTDASGTPSSQLQGWNSGFLGISWHDSRYTAVIGNFDGVNGDDVLLQRTGTGTSFLLPTNAQGELSGISQYIGGWGTDSYRILAGNFNGDAREDVFLQARQASANSAVILSDAAGHLTVTNQTWANNHLGFKWSAANAVVHAGDFDGDGRDDLLVQPKAEIVLIDYDIPIPVPVYKSNSFGITLATPAGQFVSSWDLFSRKELGLDFAPTESDLVIGDFNGDGLDDILLLARKAGQSSFVVLTAVNGTLAGANVVNLGAGTLGAELRTLAADFNGDGRSEVYRLASTGGDSNSIVSFASSGSIAANVTHNPSPVVTIAATGRTEGSASVDAAGAATYSMALWNPPGINGLQPALRLSYSSAAGNGLLGVGWQLSGLSVIHRCNSTWAQNGIAAANSQLCLDGVQLRLESGNYGQPGSKYRTELEAYSRISALGSGNTIAWFTVETNDGLIYEYGNSTDSRIESPGVPPTPRRWALNKIRDRSGNSIQFSYTEDTANGVYRIAEIAYPYSSASGLGPFHKIQFFYEPRPASDPVVPVDELGGASRETNRLARIDAMSLDAAQWQVVRQYRLTYESGASSGRSRISRLQECVGIECLAPTVMTYNNGQAGVSVQGNNITAAVVGSLTIDVNGDGRTDLVYPSGGTYSYRLATADGGLGSAFNTAVPTTFVDTALPLDFDSDGRTDIAIKNASNRWSIAKFTSEGGAFSIINTSATATGAGGMAWPGDKDGDGRPDLVFAVAGSTASVPDQIFWLRNTGTDFAAPQLWYSTFDDETRKFGTVKPFGSIQTRFRTPVRAGDFNGDGALDLLVYLRTAIDQGDGVPPAFNFGWFVLSSGGGLVPGFGTSSSSSGGSIDPIPTELNGDECDDLLWAQPSGTWRGALSNCGGTVASFTGVVTTIGVTNHERAVLLDWDADGRTDLLVPEDGTYKWYRSLGVSFGAGTFTSVLAPLTNGAARVGDFNGDGYDDLALTNRNVNSETLLHLHGTGYADSLASITDGFSVQAGFTYQSIAAAGACYQRDSAAPAFPARAYSGALYAVCGYSMSDGIGGSYSLAHTYYNANLDLQGRGLLGFGRKQTQDSRDSLVRVRVYRQDFPYLGLTSQQVVKQAGGVVIDEVLSTYSSHTLGSGFQARSVPYLSTQVVQRYEVGGPYNGQLLQTSTTTNVVDASTGALTDTVTTVTEGSNANGLNAGATQTFRTYIPMLFNDFTNWCFGRPQSIQQINSHTLPGGSSLTRSSSLTWDGPACRVAQSMIEPGNPQWEVSTSYGYDIFGNPNGITVTPAAGQGQAARTTAVSWGSTGRFPLMLTNAKSQVTQLGWNTVLGLPANSTDPNSLTVSWQYDSFARMKRQQLPDGTATEVVRSTCSALNNCGAADLRTYLQIIARDASNGVIRTDAQYLDSFDRPRYAMVKLLDGSSSVQQVTYDALGRVASQSTPFISGVESPYYTTYSYDLAGRVRQIQRPSSELDPATHLTQISYEGLTTRLTDALGRLTSRKFNAIGQVVQSLDAAGSDTDYEYDAFGQLLKSRDVANNEIALSYNVRGFKMTSNDPDLGAWSYSYFPLGELKSQTTARNQTVTFTYDALSRPLTRTEPEGVTSWTWDTAAKGTGQLAALSAPGGYSESYLYDALGRLSQQTIGADAVSYVINQSYNTLGLPETLTYPTSTAGVRFKVRYGYANGLLQSVREQTGEVAGTTFWLANTSNARGQIIDEQFGNGIRTLSTFDRITGRLDARTAGPGGGNALQNLAYRWDKLGNLTQRQDLRQGLTEAFTYDALDRLDYSTLNGVTNLDLAYNTLGNITSKSDVGTYSYHPVKKHAVTSAGSNTYTYDANGNAITRNGSSITWASYNLPTLINGSNGSSSQFSYGPERQRWKQQASFGGTIEETLYLGGVLEKVTREGVTSWRHHIAGATGEVAIHTRKSDGTTQTHYLSRDHLGSVDTVSNGTGAVEVRTAFNAYGQRRNAAGWSGAPTTADLNAITGISREGYTGHDMLDNLNLTHMNGRVYDQVAGRFLSADPFVQNPFDSQSLNRYSYVSNNPLSFTDPTGFQQAGPDDRPEPPKRRGGVVPNNERVRGTGSPGGGCKAEACLPRGYTPEEDAQFQQEYQIYLKNPVAFDQQARGSAVGGKPGLGLTLLSVGLGFIPGAGAIQSIGELVTGRDIITGETTSRALAAAGILAGLVGAKGLLKAATKADDIVEGVADVAARAGSGKRVLVDSNLVTSLAKDPTLGGRIAAGETAVVSFVTRPELRNSIARNQRLGRNKLRALPRVLDELPVLTTRPNPDTAINVRSLIGRGEGAFGDGVVGGQALDLSIPLITNDRALREAVQALGGAAR